jgi:DNA-binding XRE family transcriptional regulator
MTILRDKSKRTALRARLYEQLEADGVSLVETVRTLRKIVAKDQPAFSAEVGISLSTLRKIEQEAGNVSLAIVRRVLDHFGLQLVVKVKKRAG